MKLLNERKEKTRDILENIMDYELGYLFTNDDKDFNSFLGIFLDFEQYIKYKIIIMFN